MNVLITLLHSGPLASFPITMSMHNGRFFGSTLPTLCGIAMTLLKLNTDCVTHVASTHHLSSLLPRGSTLIHTLLLCGPYLVNFWSFLFRVRACLVVEFVLAAGSKQIVLSCFFFLYSTVAGTPFWHDSSLHMHLYEVLDVFWF